MHSPSPQLVLRTVVLAVIERSPTTALPRLQSSVDPPRTPFTLCGFLKGFHIMVIRWRHWKPVSTPFVIDGVCPTIAISVILRDPAREAFGIEMITRAYNELHAHHLPTKLTLRYVISDR